MPEVKSQKSAEDHHKQNKENIKDCRGFIVLQRQLPFFLGSGSQKFILDSFKIKRNRSLKDGSSIFKKLVRSRWLDIGFVVRDRSKKLCNGISPYISTSIVVALKRPLIQNLIISWTRVNFVWLRKGKVAFLGFFFLIYIRYRCLWKLFQATLTWRWNINWPILHLCFPSSPDEQLQSLSTNIEKQRKWITMGKHLYSSKQVNVR